VIPPVTHWPILIASTILGQIALGVAFIANVTPDGWGVAIGQFGIAGVLGFILVKLEPRLKAIEESNVTLAKAQLLLVVTLRQADEAHREEANQQLKMIKKRYPPKEPE